MTKETLKVILKGLVSYCLLITVWGTVIYFFNGAKYSDKIGTPNWFECIYFSCVSVTSIGYLDIIPNQSIGKVFVFLQTLTSIIFIGVFGGFIAYQFLKRPKNIFLTENLHIRLVDGNIFFSPRVGNKGRELIDCSANIDIIQIRNDIKWTMVNKEIRYTLLEKSWFLGINLSNRDNIKFLEALKSFYHNPDKSLVRILIMGTDIESGEMVSTAKYYKQSDVVFGGRFFDIYNYNNLERTKVNWSNLNKTKTLSGEEVLQIKNLLDVADNVQTDDFAAGCSSSPGE